MRMRLALAKETVIQGSAVAPREQQTKKVGSPCSQDRVQVPHHLHQNWERAIPSSGFDRLELAPPYALPHMNDAILQIQIVDTQTTDLTAPNSGFSENHVERAVRLTG